MPRRIPDKYKTYDELIAAIRKAGIESMQMIVGIDFSKSNEWTGEKSYKCSLHDIRRGETPYLRALRIMSRVVKEFDDDDIYPVYRFGCLNTKDKTVLPLLFPEQDDPHFHGFDAVCQAYKTVAPHIEMSGPTTFAPIIYQAIEICEADPGQLYILVILTDGDVSDPYSDMEALAMASNYPLEIVAIGLGDGPFKTMKLFDDSVRGRMFDNFQFVPFTEIEKKSAKRENLELILATAMMQELPTAFKYMKKLNYL